MQVDRRRLLAAGGLGLLATVAHPVSRGLSHDIWWVPGASGIPKNHDLTTFASAPLAASVPTGFVTTDPDTQHVVYRGTDNQIYEIAW